MFVFRLHPNQFFGQGEDLNPLLLEGVHHSLQLPTSGGMESEIPPTGDHHPTHQQSEHP
jgi:hypothetical protein